MSAPLALSTLIRAALVPWDVVRGTRAVFERDFLVLTSQIRFLIIRMAAVLIPAFVAGVIVVERSGSMFGTVGQTLMGGSATTVPLLLLLLAPAMAAPCIAAERATDTLDLVRAAPVRPSSFVIAKFASRLCTLLVLVLATTPIAAICFLYGGVSGATFISYLELTVSVAVLGVAAGTLTSAYSKSVGASVIGAYALVFVLPVIHLALIGLIGETLDVAFATIEPALAPSPGYAWFQLMEDSFTAGIGVAATRTSLLWSCGIAVVALLLATLRVAREANYRSGTRKKTRRVRALRTDRPVFERALRGSLANRPRWQAFVLLGVVLLVEALFLWAGAESNDLDEWGLHLSAMCIITGVCAFVVLAHSASGIATERKQGSMDLLLVSPISAESVVSEKVQAALWSVAPILAIPVLHGLIVTPTTDFAFLALGAWAFGSAALLFIFAAVGARFSVTASTAGRAVLQSFGVILGGAVAHAVFVSLVHLVTDNDMADEVYIFLWAGSPPVAMPMLPAMVNDMIDRRIDDEKMTAAVASIFWLLVYGGLALAVLRNSITRLRDGVDGGEYPVV